MTSNSLYSLSPTTVAVIARDPFIAQGLAFYLMAEPTLCVQVIHALTSREEYRSLLEMLSYRHVNSLVVQTHIVDDVIIQFCKWLGTWQPDAGLLFLLATHDQEQYLLALKNGIHCIVPYDYLNPRELVQAVRLVAANKEQLNHMLEQSIPLYPKGDEYASQEYVGKLNLLTVREREIFSSLLIGLSNQEIASKLCLTVKTVKNHLTAIYTKLCVKSRSEAIAEYYKALQPPQLRRPGTPSM